MTLGGRSASHQQRSEMIKEILHALNETDLLRPGAQPNDPDIRERLRIQLKNSSVMAVGEYGRAVHAEMAALTDAARRGASVDGTKMYCTTFPCHSCARHIVASGIRCLYFIEPYPKSKALELHGDALIESLPGTCSEGKAELIPFVGIAPRFFEDAFRGSERKVDPSTGSFRHWQPSTARPIYGSLEAGWATAYMDRETMLLSRLFRGDREKS